MALRNQMRETLKNVDAKLETADADAKVADPVSPFSAAPAPHSGRCCACCVAAHTRHPLTTSALHPRSLFRC